VTDMSQDDPTPVVVGVGRLTHRDANISLRDIIAESVKIAAADAAQAAASASAAEILAAADAFACPGTFFTSTANFVCKRAGMPEVYPNLPASVARAAGATAASKFFYTFESGSSPQYFVNMFAERISQGVDEVVVVAGGEVLVTTKKMGAMGRRMKPEDAEEVHAMLSAWHDEVPGAGNPQMVAVEPEVLAAMSPDPLERAAGVALPVAGYPLYEQALRKELGHSIEEHLEYDTVPAP
jgi:acetyl-CoA C-acetyltransferase